MGSSGQVLRLVRGDWRQARVGHEDGAAFGFGEIGREDECLRRTVTDDPEEQTEATAPPAVFGQCADLRSGIIDRPASAEHEGDEAESKGRVHTEATAAAGASQGAPDAAQSAVKFSPERHFYLRKQRSRHPLSCNCVWP